MSNVVYVFNSVDAYKFGTGGKGTIRSNKRLGVKLIGCWPGNRTEEQLIIGYWKQKGFWLSNADGTELFRKAPEIDAWLEWMAANSLAWPTYEEAITHSGLPFERWSPDRVGPTFPERHSDGQLSWLVSLPIEQRFREHCGKAKANIRTDDWGTPPEWADRVRNALVGGIDLDPASTPDANRKSVHAKYFYTKENSGLDRRNPWMGTVYLHPPYGRGQDSAEGFIKRLVAELIEGNVSQAIVLLQTDSLHNQWARPLWEMSRLRPMAYAFPYGRVNCIPPKERSHEESVASKGMVFVYIGRPGNKDDRKAFYHAFKDVAAVLPTWRQHPDGKPDELE